MKLRFVPALVLTASLLYPAAAHASLTTFQTLVGTYGVSTDGFGSLTQTGTISASVPLGATVVAAYLYTATLWRPDCPAVGGTLGGICDGLRATNAEIPSMLSIVVESS